MQRKPRRKTKITLRKNAGEEPPPPEEGEAEGAYPEFSIPEGLDLSDMEPGEEKEVLCLIGKTSDGTACIKQVDGVDLAGEGQGMYGPPPAAPVSAASAHGTTASRHAGRGTTDGTASGRTSPWSCCRAWPDVK